MIRTTPLYFTCCPGCQIYILTNRDQGKSISCRVCNTRHNTHQIRQPFLNSLLEKIFTKLGRSINHINEQHLLLLVQSRSKEKLPKIEQLCRSAGFESMSQQHPLAIYLKYRGLKGGLLTLAHPYSVWYKYSNSNQLGYARETPLEIEQLIRLLRHQVGKIDSLSMALTQDEWLELERNIQQSPRDFKQPSDFIDLVYDLVDNGYLAEAKARAEDAARVFPDVAKIWTILGNIDLKLKDFQAATKSLEKALEIDPVSLLSMALLMKSYEGLGQMEKLANLQLRFNSLGGSVGLLKSLERFTFS